MTIRCANVIAMALALGMAAYGQTATRAKVKTSAKVKAPAKAKAPAFDAADIANSSQDPIASGAKEKHCIDGVVQLAHNSLRFRVGGCHSQYEKGRSGSGPPLASTRGRTVAGAIYADNAVCRHAVCDRGSSHLDLHRTGRGPQQLRHHPQGCSRRRASPTDADTEGKAACRINEMESEK